jgi:hypothetical protein
MIFACAILNLISSPLGNIEHGQLRDTHIYHFRRPFPTTISDGIIVVSTENRVECELEKVQGSGVLEVGSGVERGLQA